jgi:hypothetical protein
MPAVPLFPRHGARSLRERHAWPQPAKPAGRLSTAVQTGDFRPSCLDEQATSPPSRPANAGFSPVNPFSNLNSDFHSENC